MPDQVVRRENLRNLKPFKAGSPIRFSEEYDDEQFRQIRHGFRPRDMDDKWILFCEDLTFYAHRSWTGQAVFKVEFESTPSGVKAAKALVSPDMKKVWSLDYSAALLNFLIANLLLGERRPFPRPEGVPSLSGVYQHHVVGKGYPEIVHPKKK